MRSFTLICCALLTIILLPLGCADRSTAVKDELRDIPRAGSFTWVSTSVIYSGIVPKKPASLLVITKSACPWCDSLEQWTLKDSTVMGMINAWFNPAIINADSDSLIVIGDSLVSCSAAAKDVFRVHGYPTTIFFDHRGVKYSWVESYIEPEPFADHLYQVYNNVKDR